jgi:hypothetical protein
VVVVLLHLWCCVVTVPLFKQQFDFSLDSRCRCCCCSDPCSPVALGVALPRLLLLPDLLRSAVFSCWCHVKALSQLFCSFCSDPTVYDALGLFGSKESFMPAMICHRGLWYVNLWILSVLADSSFAVLHLNRCIHIFFFSIWFRSRSRVRWVVLDVFMFVLVCCYPLGLDLKPIVVGMNCFISNGCQKVNWVRLMSPQFVVLSFILCLLYLGYGRGFRLLFFCF